MSKHKTPPRPLVSVVIAAYNVESYIEHCLDTLLGQTLHDIEIIVVEDRSTDGTKDIIKSYAQKDPRIVPVYNSKNLGLSGARNRGIGKARAEYLMFCDSDDYCELDMCEKLYHALSQTGADAGACEDDVVYHAHREMKPSDDYYYSLKFSGLNPMSDELVLNTDVSVHNKIFRHSVLDKYDLRFIEGLLYEDAYFTVAYFCVSQQIYYLNEKLYHYVRREHSIMSDTWSTDKTKDRALDHLYEAFHLYDFLEAHNLLAKYNDLFWQLFYRYEEFAISHSKTNERREQVRREAQDFIAQHQADFDKAEAGSRNEIKSLHAHHFLNNVRLKKIALHLMPTYRLEINNVLRLRTLKNRQRNLINQVNHEIKIKP